MTFMSPLFEPFFELCQLDRLVPNKANTVTVMVNNLMNSFVVGGTKDPEISQFGDASIEFRNQNSW